MHNSQRTVVIEYTNYKGVRSTRTIEPKQLYFGSTNWHPEVQWLLAAFDVEKNEERTFAMKDIHSWG